MYFFKIFGFCIILHLSFCQEEIVFHCSAKPGCQISQCDPLPSRWSQSGFSLVKNLNRHEFPITCKSGKIQKSDNGFLLSLMQGNVQDIRTMRSKMDKLEEKFEQSSKKVEDTPDLSTKKASELQESQDQLKNEIKELKRVNQNFQEKLSILIRTDDERKKELLELKISNQNLKTDVVQLTKANDNMEQRIKELENELSTLGKTDQIRKQEVKALENKLKEVQDTSKQDMQELKIQIKELSQIVESNTKSKEQDGDEDATAGPPTGTTRVRDSCEFEYNSKCFQAIIYPKRGITFADAQKICNDMGWQLANLYDVTHYRMLKIFSRSKIPSTRVESSIWTGMTYKNKILRLRAGKKLSPLPTVWQTGFPFSSELYSHVALAIHKDKDYKYQGIGNLPPQWDNHGALCEL